MAELSRVGRFAMAGGVFLLLAAGWAWLAPSDRPGESDSVRAPASPQARDEAALESASAGVSDSGSTPRSISIPDPRASASTRARDAAKGDTVRAAGSSAPGEGASQRTKEWVEERYEAAQERRAAIKDEATRNHRKQNREELARSWAIEFALIDEIGVEAYEQSLYDRGLKNRAEVRWLGSGSNAMLGGVQIGDVILSYGGQPVFAPQSLRERNKLLEPGQQIVIEVEREGVVFAFVIQTDDWNRGRSGIVNGMSLRPISREP